MAGADGFKVEGAVVEALRNGTYRVELPNGHRVLAFESGKRSSPARLAPGEKVTLRMSPYDLSQGRIVAETKSR